MERAWILSSTRWCSFSMYMLPTVTPGRMARRSAVEEHGLAVSRAASAFVQQCLRISLSCRAVEDRGRERARRASSPAQPRWVSRICPTFMRRGHAQRVEDDVDRRAVREVRHVLLGQDPARPRPCCRGGRPSCRRPDSLRLMAT